MSKNKYQHNDDGTTQIIVQNKNKYFPVKHIIIIDTEDWGKVKEHRWRIFGTASCTYPYALTNILHPDGGWYVRPGTGRRVRRRTGLLLHHLIMGKPQKGKVIDHWNHSGLDNRRANLKEITYAQNNQNSRSVKNSTSQYKGVYWKKDREKWRARIKDQGEEQLLGYYTCEHQAALAYNKKALELWGEYALLNDVDKA